MTHELFIADRLYSSWSLRGWLVCAAFDIPHRVRMARLYSGQLLEDLAPVAPARQVPAMRLSDGAVVWDSLAIAEELAQRHPDSGLWPEDFRARATARSLTAEMHAGFTALRTACPMNLLVAYRDTGIGDDPAVRADLDRLESLWNRALDLHGGMWLCGEYCVADAFFAPVAARIAGYDLPVGDHARKYVDAHLSHARFRQWRAMGLAANSGAVPPQYAMDHPTRPWPGPQTRAASPVATGPSVNEACPFSGEPVAEFVEIGGTVYGFCNAFCRDKIVADPDAWPDFLQLEASFAA